LRTARIIGPGRVGRSLARALTAAGWSMAPQLGRGDDVGPAARGVDLVLITTTDDAIRRVAAAIAPEPDTVVAHCSGAHSLDVLEPHARRASVHPLASIPDEHIGAERLAGGCSFAVDGDSLVEELVEALGGRSFRVDPADRVRYHAAAVMASNHLVALLGQVERVAAQAGLPVDAYLDLVEQTLANVRRLGPAAALTGPVARGDWATVYRHLLAVGPAERHAYEAMASQASRLVGRDEPSVGSPSVGAPPVGVPLLGVPLLGAPPIGVPAAAGPAVLDIDRTASGEEAAPRADSGEAVA
jgi:predicted short-subunit dehydrogenase-like oxidoreductase (DUF2520 family)